jgi:hypothetical protein
MSMPTPQLPAGKWPRTPRGFVIRVGTETIDELERTDREVRNLFEHLGVTAFLAAPDQRSSEHPRNAAGPYVLSHASFDALTPDFNTMDVARKAADLGVSMPEDSADMGCLRAEIVLSLLASPVQLDFPSLGEFLSAIEVRCDIVDAARYTSMEFHTGVVDRPEQFWNYSEDTGFTLKPGCALIEALEITTQPRRSGRLYGFSCYRATEYVILLGVAREAKRINQKLLTDLERQWHVKAIASGRFHESFLQEIGTNENPLPMGWYIPGDRVWFRNPDAFSSDVSGYEGSWVIYLGQGLFANFWKPDQPFDLVGKCLEVFFWRAGARRDPDGEMHMDESIVEARVTETRRNPEETMTILDRMLRLRDPQGVYAEGGCMDNTREWPRWLRPGTCDIRFPET